MSGLTSAWLPGCARSPQAPAPAQAPAGTLATSPEARQAAARREGKLVIYTALEESLIVRLRDAFANKHGVILEYQRLNSGDIAARYSAEANAARTQADVVLTGDHEIASAFAQKGWLAKLDALSVPGHAEWPVDYREEYAVIVTIEPFTIAVNTQLMRELPRDWSVLLRAEFKDMIITTDLRKVGISAFNHWDLLLKTYGAEYLRKLGQQRLRLFDSGASCIQQLAAGAGKLFCPCPATFVAAMRTQGAPLAGVVPEGGPYTGMISPATISAHAPHPNAARLFVSFLLTADGQAILNQVASSPNGTAGTAPLPAGFVKPDWQSAAANREKILGLLEG